MQVYMVAKGDTLWMIAKKFGISLEEVIKANPQIKDPNRINTGTKVNIPLPVENGKSAYTVQSGDTMWSIAKKFSISLDTLLAANPQVTDADVIQMGQIIYIPLRSARQSDQLTYTVQSGDTLWKISQKYGITLDALLAANTQIKNADQIYPGQTVNVPLPVSNPPVIGVNNGVLYFVKSGDTVANIAQRYAISQEALLVVNPQIANVNLLSAGVQLYLPGFHYVRSGETFSSIASLYNVDLETLIAVNPQISDTDNITSGEKITIPRQTGGNIATYTVKQGDTLYKIAQKYNMPVEAVINANHDIISADLIYPNQKLQIPGPHLVQRGQTLYSIANIYGISLAALKAANPEITDPDMINLQTMINIPVVETYSCRATKTAGVDYIVQSGDTLTSIAKMYQVPLAELIDYNPQISDVNNIRIGTIVHIPTGYVAHVCYMVQQGDTIYRIARRYQVSVNAILRANPQITNADYIETGMVLMIPIRDGRAEPHTVEERDGESSHRAVKYPEIYVVQKGDSLYSIAVRFKTTVKQLRLANAAIKDSDTIYPGQQLIILPADMVCEYRCLECPWLEQGIES